ncbi:hypothetical protein FB567DRAFT_6031 [Paraphoma chrysanthemicola]|uniref:Uncharacterized protein n=1 Tax=Paraphoma chrysanthemicola TaxID=798071 RepID=A0A8K0W4U8_9PLEO|nr:hypothetical protein FB567DRAFT_6031 [Paraphoma chrysanthemicola]
MPRIFEAYPTLRQPNDAPPPYSEHTVPSSLATSTPEISSPAISAPAASTPAPILNTHTPRHQQTFGTLADWSERPAGKRAISQLLRYLIEILAFTFDADMTILNAALGQSEDDATVLIENERASLLALSHLIRSMNAKVGNSEWLTVPDNDYTTVLEAVSKPVKFLKVRVEESFVFGLLASYVDHECDPARRTMTLVAQRIPGLLKFRSVWGDPLLMLGATVRSHVDIVLLITESESIRKVLGEAIIKWQERRGLQSLVIQSTVQATHGYWEMAKAVGARERDSWWL